MGWPITIESCSWIDFIYVAYARWYHWTCGRTQRKAATINQLACPSYSLYVQLLWYPMYYPEGRKARVSPVQWSKPHSILAPTQDSNPGGRIQNHERWPLHYHCTLCSGDHYTTTAHWCLFNSLLCLNFLSQSGQTNGFSPVGILRCKFNSPLCVNFIIVYYLYYLYRSRYHLMIRQFSLKPTFQWFEWEPVVGVDYTTCFRVSGPTVWNSLPDDITNPELTLEHFKTGLKTHLVCPAYA